MKSSFQLRKNIPDNSQHLRYKWLEYLIFLQVEINFKIFINVK